MFWKYVFWGTGKRTIYYMDLLYGVITYMNMNQSTMLEQIKKRAREGRDSDFGTGVLTGVYKSAIRWVELVQRWDI